MFSMLFQEHMLKFSACYEFVPVYYLIALDFRLSVYYDMLDTTELSNTENKAICVDWCNLDVSYDLFSDGLSLIYLIWFSQLNQMGLFSIK